jgi:hypothetical protein
MPDGVSFVLHLPRPGEPESALVAGMAAVAPLAFDTSISGPVMLQEPARWSYTIGSDGNSLASYPGNVFPSGGSSTGINVKAPPFNAVGNGTGVATGASITAGTNVLTSPAAHFQPADQGKAIIVGAYNVAPLITTITGVLSTTVITLAANAITTLSGNARYVYGTDDTAAIASAVAAGQATGQPVIFPAGTYMLASQTVPISLSDVSLIGTGQTANYFPFQGSGTLLCIFNSASVAFSGVGGTKVSNIGFWYPAIDNSQVTPPVYPALFQSDASVASHVNNSFDSVRVLNAYVVFSTTQQGSFGRTWINNCLMYGVNAICDFAGGFADSIFVNNSYFGPGAFGVEAAPGNLQNYTAANGAVFRLHATGASTFPNCDGLLWFGGLVNSYRYGIQLQSGLLDVSCITGVNWDFGGSILDVSGTGYITSTAFCGGEAYLQTPNAAAAYNAFNFNTSATPNDLTITGLYLAQCSGSIVWDQQGTLRSLAMSGSRVLNWGRSATTASYYLYACPGAQSGNYSFTGNIFDGQRLSSSNSLIGFFVSLNNALASVNLSGNVFVNTTQCLTVQGTAGKVTATGNVATDSAVANADNSSGTLLVSYAGNMWDITPATRLPAATGTGTSVTAGSTNLAGNVTLGAGLTATTVTFTTPLPYAPRAVIATAASGTVSVSAVSSTGFTLTASTAATVVNYQAVL